MRGLRRLFAPRLVSAGGELAGPAIVDAPALLVAARAVRLGLAGGAMNNECVYAAMLLRSLVEPAAELAAWLDAPVGEPPVHLGTVACAMGNV